MGNRKRASINITLQYHHAYPCCIGGQTLISHRYLLLENLLIAHKCLIHSDNKQTETAKETNWEQKFQKLQNENICLTSVNTEINGNFHFLSFGVVSWRRKIEGKTMLLKMKTLAKMRICQAKVSKSGLLMLHSTIIFKNYCLMYNFFP